jgi:signal peptidase I
VTSVLTASRGPGPKNSGPKGSGPKHAAPRRRRPLLVETIILLVLALLAALIVRAFVLQTFYIPSGSMEHTLNINDRVLVNKLVYDFRSPSRGEVIVFTSPVSWRTSPNEDDFIKRVIGVGGDHVVCCDSRGRLIINGSALNEPYLNHDEGSNLPASPDRFDILVPPGRLWVMGDNRFFSGDSREQYVETGNIEESTISVKAVIGRAIALFWPMGRSSWFSVPASDAHIPDPGGR